MTEKMKWIEARKEVIEGIRVRDKRGGFKVYISGKLLSPKRSQRVYNHSPDGFSWAYSGSGPAQLALGILLEFLPKEEAKRYYQKFKSDIIAGLPKGDFEMSIDLVNKWIKENCFKEAK